jgi:FKBP-type peptidyl-prolyl cis-trans isomerase
MISCEGSDPTKQPIVITGDQMEDTLIVANKFLLEKDKEQIQSYIKRRNLNMQMTESGLWYEIYNKTNNKNVKSGDIVVYDYELSLLDGTICYNSDTSGKGKIKIGQSGKEFGLDEGLLMMKIGEKAIFIIPPYLAHGLIGDMEKIPARSTVVYDVEIIDIIEF